MRLLLSRISALRLVAVAVLLGGAILNLSSAADNKPATTEDLRSTLRGHTDVINAIAYSPDGQRILTASFDNSLKLWDAATGKELKTFAGQAGHQKMVLSAAFSPDRQSIASGSADGTAKIWDVPATKPLHHLVHADAVEDVALSADGKTIAGACHDGTIHLWNTADGKELRVLRGHEGPVTSVSIHGNNQLIASGGQDGTVRVWNVGDGKLLGTVYAHRGPLTEVAFHPNGSWILSSGNDGKLRIWQWPFVAPRPVSGAGQELTSLSPWSDGGRLVTGAADGSVQIRNLDGGLVRAFDKAGKVQAVAGGAGLTVAGTTDGHLQVWNADNGQLLARGDAADKTVTALAMYPQERGILSGGRDGRITRWTIPPTQPGKMATLKVKQAWQAHKGGVTVLSNFAGAANILSGGADGEVKLWEAKTGKLVRNIGKTGSTIAALAVSRDNTRVAAAANKTVTIWDAGNGRKLHELHHPVAVLSVSFSGDRSRLVTGAADGFARVWDAHTAEELEAFRYGGPVRGVIYGNDNRTIVVGGDHTPLVIDTVATLLVIPAIKTPLRTFGIAAYGGQLLTGTDDGKLVLWNINNGNRDRTFPGDGKPARAVAASRNNQLLASGGTKGQIRLYTLNNGQVLATFAAPAGAAKLEFSADSRTLAAACDDGSLILWDVTYNPGQPVPMDFGKPLETYPRKAAVTSVTFAPDGHTVAASSRDKAIRIWKVMSPQPRNLQHGPEVDAVAFNSKGTLLATGSHDGLVRIWDAAKGNVVRQIAAHNQPMPATVYSVAWSPDDRYIVSASLDTSLKLWDASNGNLVRTFAGYKAKTSEKGHREGVFCAAFSPDGKWLASGSSDRTVRIWNVATGQVSHELINPDLKPFGFPTYAPSHPGWVFGLRYTPDGKRLVTVGNAPAGTGYLAIWNADTGKLLSGRRVQLGPLYCLAISPDGKWLALGCGPRHPGEEANAYVMPMK